MLAIRWTRRVLDLILLAAILGVLAIGLLTISGQAFHGRALIIGGGSMEPALPRGAFELSLPVGDAEYRVDDVVTVAQPGKTPYTHRIIRILTLPKSANVAGGTYVETKGDANATAEPVVVSIHDVAGRVAVSVPFLGYLATILSTPLGMLGFLAACLMLVLAASSCDELEDRLLQRRRAGAIRRSAREAEPDAVPSPLDIDQPAAAVGLAGLAGWVLVDEAASIAPVTAGTNADEHAPELAAAAAALDDDAGRDVEPAAAGPTSAAPWEPDSWPLNGAWFGPGPTRIPVTSELADLTEFERRGVPAPVIGTVPAGGWRPEADDRRSETDAA